MGNVFKSKTNPDSLKQENERLKKEIETLKHQLDEIDTKPGSKLSKERLNEIVENMIQDENVNIDYLPDWVERKIYRNVFTILINLLDESLETTKVKLLGHQINFNIEAV